jgi:pSer/pThr/pTyr-binding forkhead associated (FHA) protein
MSGSGEGWVIAGFDESGHVQRFRFQILDERLCSSSGLRIGRSEKDNEIVIPDSSISRSHARFIAIGRELYLEDLGSKNGTFIGNTRVKPSDKQRVWGDQELRFGDVVFSVGRE